MNKPRVALTHLGAKLDSPFYRELLAVPPLQYVNRYSKAQREMVLKGSKFSFMNNVARHVQKWSGVPNMWYIKQDCDLIHAAHHLVLNKKPWIVDFEIISSLAGFTAYRSPISKYLIPKLLRSEHCKKILPWTNAAQESMKTYIGKANWQQLKSKTEIVYPAVRPQKQFKKKKDKKVRLLFISRFFKHKGGLEALQTFDALTRKYDNIECLMFSNVPEHIKTKYNNNAQIKIKSTVPREVLTNKIWPSTDIFLYPSWGDTFGFPILEAQSFGVPVVALKDFAAPELIMEGKTGHVLPGYKKKWYGPDYFYTNYKLNHTQQERDVVVRSLAKKTGALIENNRLRTQMGKNARKEIEQGRFSIKKRNQRMNEIYQDAVKRSS